MRIILRAAVIAIASTFPLHALTLPSQGYIVYTLSDGAMYRRMLGDSQGAKIINAGKSPNINPKNGGIIVYVESGNRAILTDPDGLSHRAIGGTYSGMSGVYWTDRGDRFTFMYGSHQWGIMDTLGNFKQIPVPPRVVIAYCADYSCYVTCSSDPKKQFETTDPVREGGLSFPIIRGNLVMFNCQPRVQLAHIDQDHPENGIPQSSQVAPGNGLNGCFGTLSPNGEAYAHHSGGHGEVCIVSIGNQANGTICAGNAYSYEVRSSSQDYSSYGIKWSNDFQWMVVRSEKDRSWNVVHLPPAGSTTPPDNPPYQVFQSYGTNQLYYGDIDMWVGPFTRANMAGPPVISSAATAAMDSVVITIAAADAQSTVYYTLNGVDPTQQSTRYAQPFGLHITADSVVVKARAFKAGVDPSSVTRYVAHAINGDAITAIRYYPRAEWASRMVGGIFEGSNGDKDAGPYSAIYTVSAQPANGQWTEVAVPAATNTAYRFVRYRAGGNCNVAEIEFYRGAVKITGTPFGTPGTWANGMDYTRAWDGDVTTFFDYSQTDGGYTGLDLDSSANPTPQITILSPVAGTVYHLGDTMKIRWTYSPGASVRVMCSNNNGRTYLFEVPPVNCSADGSGAYSWPLTSADTAMVSTQAKVAIVDYSDPNIRGISGAFTIGRPGATAGNRASPPPAGEGFVIWGNSITFNKAAGGPIPLVTITGANGRSYYPHATRGGASVHWDAGSLPAGVYAIKIRTPKTEITRRIAIER